MAKNLFNNEDVLKWMQYFADNTPIDLEQITMMNVTKGNANIIPMVEAHKAVLAFMEAGDKEVFYRMWNAGLGDCEVWYNEGSKPEGAIKHDSLKDMIDRGINESAGMLVVNKKALSTNKSGLGNLMAGVSSKEVGKEIRNIIMSKMRIDSEDTVVVVGGEVVAIDAAFRANEGRVVAVEYNHKEREALEENISFYDLRNVTVLDRVGEENLAEFEKPNIAFIVASASTEQEIKFLTELNPDIILVVYTLDFVAAGRMKELYESIGIKDPEIIQIQVSRLKSNNTFTVEPAPWIITGCREAVED